MEFGNSGILTEVVSSGKYKVQKDILLSATRGIWEYWNSKGSVLIFSVCRFIFKNRAWKDLVLNEDDNPSALYSVQE